MKTINNRYATRRGEPMCSPRYPHTVAMEGRHIGLPLRWMNAVGRYIGLLGIHIGLPLLFLAACTQDDIAPAYNDAPLTITATIPGDVWAVATRAEGESTVTYSDWTLHYTDYQGQAATGTLTATPSQDGTYTLTSDNDLVWAKVNTTKPMHLTARCDNGTPSDATDDYTLHTSVPSATAGEELAFPDMKHTLAKLTVNFTLSHNMAQVDYSDFTISVTAKAAKTSTADEVVYYPMTHGGTWPVADGDAATTAFTLSQQSAVTGTYTITGSILLPQQTMGNTMIVTYKETTWTLDLSAVAVTGGEEGKMANELIAGQHLTLNLKAGLTAINTPSDIQIEAFTAADADDYTPDLGSVAKTYEYDAANNTYYIYHEKCIEAALADRAANNRTDAAIVSKAPTLAVVDGAETDLATMQAAIARKSTVIVTGEALAPYSNENSEDEAKTVVGEAIRQLMTNTTFSIVLPDATEIGENAFYGCTDLTSVSLPAAETIGKNALYNCTSLTSVSLPATTSIGNEAFAFCTALTSVSLPEATSIGINAFYNCAALESVSLPAAKTIGNEAFQECIALTSVSLPAAEKIGNAAFRICSALTSVSAPKATTIEYGAFFSCTSLTSVSLPAAETIGNSAFNGCADLTSVSLPSATSIGGSAFQACTALTIVSLPAATSIGDYAFYTCSALTSVSLPAATSIGINAFLKCVALKSVSLPDVTEIGINAFNGCYALASVSAPKATLIGKSSFSNCADLTSVSLPKATLIGETAFTNCTALESLSLPAAKTIGDCAFQACTALKSVSLPDVTEIGIYAFNGCTALKSVSLPDVTEIGIYAFSICADLTSVSLPAATSIGKGAFSNCADLTSVSLPAAETIGNSAFNGCADLTSVSLPSATSIGNQAFNGCTALTSLTFGSVITSVGTDVFDGTLADGTTAWTTQCDLTLGTGTTAGDPDVENKTWADKTWKSITLK